MIKKYNIAIIGAGRIAGHHVKSIKKEKGLNLVAICDLNIERAKKFSIKYKVPYFLNFNEMLKKIKNIDIVSIMTPSGCHYEHAKAILLNFKKHLIIEKPTFLKIEQVKNIYKIAKKNKKKIFPVFQNRFNKAVQKISSEIKKNKLGKINFINVRVRWCRPQRYYNLSPWRGTYSHDGGALTNQGIHHIDLLRFLGGEVKSVYCKMKTMGAKIEVEDSVVGFYEFKNGSLGSLEITTAARPNDFEASISILGSKGLAQIGGLAVNNIEIFTPNFKICKKYSEKIPDAYGFGHDSIYKEVYKSLILDKEFIINSKDCLNTIKLLNSFYVSDETGKRVFVKKTKPSKRLGRKNEKIAKLYRYEK